jgi:serine/threonine protein kinase/tetratricopeptide (TPR) repeat protein
VIAPASRHLGKYEILQKLGRGGMADVYLAQDTALGYQVALKLIEHSADPDIRDAIEAERRGAELQAHLAAIDPRVVQVYDAGDLEGFFFVAMEYIDGQDLAELMRRGPLGVEFAVDTAVAVAETLHHAHNLEAAAGGKDFRGIVHGDIKPKNIRIDARGNVRVLDFGIAKALSLSRRLTRNEFGSVPYASPERLDSGQVNSLSDLWSLAVMLYEMITGLQPYHAESTERLERMIRSRIPPPPAPDPCPEPLRRILIKAMAPVPEFRYQSARELADELHAFRTGGVVRAATEDLDATRRTWHGDDEETRRTSHDEGPAEDETRRTAQTWPVPQTQSPAARKRRSGTFGTVVKTIGVLILACMVYGAYAGVSDYLLYKHGQQLERDIQTEQLSDPDQIWAKWTELSGSNPSSLLLHGPRKVVKQKFIEAAEHVISTYRNSESQPVYEKDWERARTLLARALEVDPDDSIRGELRLSEGHIARINGISHRSPTELNLAVEKFSQAEKLMPKSPDPELGLARVYVYGLKDIDKAYEALQNAEKRGYQLGNREKLQLADGYRERADRLWWDSRNVRGLPQEKDQIERAAGDYQHALNLYQSIAPWGNANAQVARVQGSLDSVNFRLQEIALNMPPANPDAQPHL